MSAPALTHGGESSDGAWRFGRIWKKNATQMMIFLPIENVGRKITTAPEKYRLIIDEASTK